MHYRALERNKIQGLGPAMNYDNKISLSGDSRYELDWWLSNVESKNGKPVRPPKVSIYFRSDASLIGWGAIDLNSARHANGRWTLEESQKPINFLELLAIFHGLLAFYDRFSDVHVQIQSDNVCAVTYINSMGGMASRSMDLLAGQIWKWCLERNIYISAVHIPGTDNTADFFSRNFSDSTEWMLKREIFSRLCRHFFQPNVDLFASRLNKQLPCFVSWFPELGAIASDAFTLDWKQYSPYIFPPFNLVGKVLNKIISDGVDRAILVFPIWRSQSWFPVLLECIVSFPVRLPRHKDMLRLPHNSEVHPMNKKLRMGAVIVSGKSCRRKDFLVDLRKLSPTPGNKGLEDSIDTLGDSGLLGTILGVPVPLIPLKL